MERRREGVVSLSIEDDVNNVVKKYLRCGATKESVEREYKAITIGLEMSMRNKWTKDSLPFDKSVFANMEYALYHKKNTLSSYLRNS